LGGEVKVTSISVAAGLVTLLLWISLIWLTSVNLFAEGPDTRTATILAKPIEWWGSLVRPVTTAIVDAIGLQRQWGGTVIDVALWLGPFVAVLSAGWFPLVSRYVGARAAQLNR
jgi:hypothetical protein